MKQIPLMWQRVTDSSQAVIYLFSRFCSNRRIPCVQCECATFPILNHMPQTFSLLPVFRRFLEGCQQGKNSVTLINVAIKFGDEYFCFGIYFSKFFLSKLFSKIFFGKTFFENYFSKIFFVKTFFENFFFNIFFQNFSTPTNSTRG